MFNGVGEATQIDVTFGCCVIVLCALLANMIISFNWFNVICSISLKRSDKLMQRSAFLSRTSKKLHIYISI